LTVNRRQARAYGQILLEKRDGFHHGEFGSTTNLALHKL
jgi:hypothetical protein